MGSTKLFQKVIFDNNLAAYTQYIKQSMIEVEGTRRVRHSYIKRASKSIKTSKSLFYRAVKIHNTLLYSIKCKEPKVFNKEIKPIIRKTYSPDKVP